MDVATDLINSKPKVTRLTKVPPLQLILLNLQRPLQNLLRLGSSNRHVHRDLFVTTDRERTDRVSGFGGDGGLTGELFEDFGGSGETITGFTDGDVCTDDSGVRVWIGERGGEVGRGRTDDQLLDTEFPHGVLRGGLDFRHFTAR